MLKVSEVIKYIEEKNNIHLLDIQKDCLKHIIAGDVIYTPRCFGRSMLYDGYADYLKNVVGKYTDYSTDPADFDVIYTDKDIRNTPLCSKELMKKFKSENAQAFGREYECKYGTNKDDVEINKPKKHKKHKKKKKKDKKKVKLEPKNIMNKTSKYLDLGKGRIER
jgi:hypothetical protein